MPFIPPEKRARFDHAARIARSARIRVELPAHRADGDGGEGDDGVVPLPKFVRFVDLKAARIVDNWTQLKRIVETEGFPPGIMLAPNTRAWVITEVIAWLATRPPAGAVKKLESA